MLSVDHESSVPPFEQLRQQIAERVLSGELRPGDRLPTVRRLADELSLAPNTVARTYRELESDGMLEGRGRAGTFVSDDHANNAAKAAARAYADTVRSLGLDVADAVALVQRAMGN